MHHQMCSQKGFTLLELLIAMTIMVILTTIAVPSFNSIMQSSRLTSNVSSIVGSINLARSEAVRLGEPVKLENKSGGGWKLIIDSTHETLKVFEPPTQDITISRDSNVSTLTFQATGFRSFGSAAGIIKVCDGDGNGTDITVSTGGSVRSEASSSC